MRPISNKVAWLVLVLTLLALFAAVIWSGLNYRTQDSGLPECTEAIAEAGGKCYAPNGDLFYERSSR